MIIVNSMQCFFFFFSILLAVNRPPLMITISQAGAMLRDPSTLLLEARSVEISSCTEVVIRVREAATLREINCAVLHTDEIECAPMWNLCNLEHLARHFPRRVVVFDRVVVTCPAGIDSRGDAASRVWTALRLAGVHAMVVVDPTEALHSDHMLAVHRSGQLVGNPLQRTRQLWIDAAADVALTDHVVFAPAVLSYDQMLVARSRALVVDCRSRMEFDGLSSGYSYVSACGRIPESVSVPNDEYQNAPQDQLALRLAARLAELGYSSRDSAVILYCGTGWRASRLAVLMCFLGYRNVAIYDGGWHEWSQLHLADR